MRKIKSVGILVSFVAAVLATYSANIVAADADVHATFPVGETAYGKDITFDWYLDHYSNPQSTFYIYSSAVVDNENPEGKTGPYYGTNTEYTWKDFPQYGYGWWWVNVYKDRLIPWYGQIKPKSFHREFPADWEGPLNYKTIYQPNGRLMYFELQKDFTIYIPDYFLFPTKLPDQWESDKLPYGWSMFVSYPVLDWDFVRFSSGRLTIKQGYRWDGASYPCKNLGSGSCIDDTFDVPSSLVHDSLYDLMRMGYLVHDKALSLFDEGYYNRLMADLLLYMVAVEEGKPLTWRGTNKWPVRKEGAESDHDSMRFWGAGATHDNDRLAEWKYHVSELTATASDGRIDLTWKPANDAGKEPYLHYALNIPHPGYRITRLQRQPPKLPIITSTVVDSTTTSYTDNDVTDGVTYTYRLSRIKQDLSEFPETIYYILEIPYVTNFEDYSNIAQATAINIAPTVDAGPDDTIDEGDTFTSSGSFIDPGDDTWTATVDYGDGSGVQSLALIGKTFDLSNVYADNGVYTVTVTVTDSDGGVGTDAAQITVNNVAPTVSIDSVNQPNSHFILPVVHTLTFNGSFTDPGWLDTHSSNWDFDDGTDVAGTLTEENTPPDSTGDSSSQHVYSTAGVYNVILGVMDNDGGIGTDTGEITVISPAEAIAIIDQYIQDLPGNVFKNNAGQRKNAFSDKLAEIPGMIFVGTYHAAINKLQNDIRAKTDGLVDGKSNDDWIRSPETQQEICTMIDDLTAYLETL